MTYCLVDNATLSGVQRLLGEIPLRSRDVVEADIAALENLLEGILLFDEVVAIDDYKQEHREERAKRFNFIRFLESDGYGLPAVRDAVDEVSATLEPKIAGGEFADGDLAPLLRQLKMHMVCTWDLASSVYYLTMKILGNPDRDELQKYGQLQAAIFGELQDLFETSGSRYNTDVVLLDSKGAPINDEQSLVGEGGRELRSGGLTKSLGRVHATRESDYLDG